MRCEYGARLNFSGYSRAKLHDPANRNAVELTVTHELGHVLGLAHARRGCALMRTYGFQRDRSCPKPPNPWQIRCRLLERDDVLGAIRRYGGRMKPLGPEFCDRAPAPAAPTGLQLRYDSAIHSVVATWDRDRSLYAGRMAAVIAVNVCPTAFDADDSDGRSDWMLGEPRKQWEVFRGRWCVAVWQEDAWGRIGPSATAFIDAPRHPDEDSP